MEEGTKQYQVPAKSLERLKTEITRETTLYP